MNISMVLLVRVEAISRDFRQIKRASSPYKHHFLVKTYHAVTEASREDENENLFAIALGGCVNALDRPLSF